MIPLPRRAGATAEIIAEANARRACTCCVRACVLFSFGKKNSFVWVLKIVAMVPFVEREQKCKEMEKKGITSPRMDSVSVCGIKTKSVQKIKRKRKKKEGREKVELLA